MKNTAFLVPVIAAAFAASAAPVRPYELDWAGRTEDDTPALCALEDFTGWRTETENAEASLSRSPDNLLFGAGTARVTYRATGAAPVVRILPPAPVAITGRIDAVSLWVCGNVSPAHHPDPSTPITEIDVEFAGKDGKRFSVPLAYNNHLDWFKEYRMLSADEAGRVSNGGAFLGFTLRKGTNRENRTLDLNRFSVFVYDGKPPEFPKRPKRGVRLFKAADQGVNTGEGRLPFPDRETTVIPCPEKEDPDLQFGFPKDPNRWDDLKVRWKNGPWMKVACGGGVFPPTARAKTRFSRVGNSIVAEVEAPAGDVEEVRFGAVTGLVEADFIPVPYYVYKQSLGTVRGRPGVISASDGKRSFFISETVDWTQSSASELFGEKTVLPDGSFGANGGARYFPKTDGRRNGCFERFVWSFSTEFADVLPVIPNPPSPWRALTGSNTWIVHSPSRDRQKDVDCWKQRQAEGLRNMIITDHEPGWRDRFESFTFRTRAAPAKGGDKGQYDYARTLIDGFGYRYGLYNSFCDIAPVNEIWNPELVSRDRDGQLRRSWERCYQPRPAWIPGVCEKFTAEIQRKFKLNTGYCDVHTCVSPWSRVDYDARVPGAGTFAQTFYSFGEVMLIQKRHWNGPVYSEGGLHWMYAGLTDGNYAQDPSYQIYNNPWLVDFDLLRIHPLETDFGMGVLQSFPPPENRNDPRRDVSDRFLAATLAFGHSPFLFWSAGGGKHIRCDMMVRPISSRYAAAEAVSIRYAGRDGSWYGTSAAIRNGAYRRSQVRVKYSEGTEVAVNGNRRENLVLKIRGVDVVLPPNGWLAVTGDGQALSFSGLMHGKRAEYGVSSDGLYSERDGKCSFTRETRPVADVMKEILAAQTKPGWRISEENEFARPLPWIFEAIGYVRYNDLWALWSSGKEKRRAMFVQPVSSAGKMVSPCARYRVRIGKRMRFECEVGKCDGSHKGDGVTCRVVVEEPDGRRTVAAERHLTEYGWEKISADLSRWSGRRVFLRLETDPGPAGNHSGDWALWSEMRLVGR